MSEALLERFRMEAARDRLADCNLFLGPSRPRLRELARACAALLLEARGRLEDHPDAVIFDPLELEVRGLQVAHIAEREGDTPSVEAALRYKPLRGGRRVLLLFEVDRMGPDAQAALLKTTEEPPAATHLLLTAADPTPILPALLSRCRIARVAAPPREELERRAAAAGIEPAAFATLAAGLGRPEAVLDLAADLRQELLDAAAAFQAWAADPRGELRWAEPPDGSLAEQREKLGLRLASCLGWLRAGYPEATPTQVVELDRLAALLAEALGDLGNQITPSLILEDLVRRVRASVTSPWLGSENTIS